VRAQRQSDSSFALGSCGGHVHPAWCVAVECDNFFVSTQLVHFERRQHNSHTTASDQHGRQRERGGDGGLCQHGPSLQSSPRSHDQRGRGQRQGAPFSLSSQATQPVACPTQSSPRLTNHLCPGFGCHTHHHSHTIDAAVLTPTRITHLFPPLLCHRGQSPFDAVEGIMHKFWGGVSASARSKLGECACKCISHSTRRTALPGTPLLLPSRRLSLLFFSFFTHTRARSRVSCSLGLLLTRSCYCDAPCKP